MRGQIIKQGGNPGGFSVCLFFLENIPFPEDLARRHRDTEGTEEERRRSSRRARGARRGKKVENAEASRYDSLFYSTNEQIKSIVSSSKSSVTDSLYEAFLAAISKHFTCSHIISPVVFVLSGLRIKINNNNIALFWLIRHHQASKPTGFPVSASKH